LWTHQEAQIAPAWKPPPEGFIKINTDASFIPESGVGSAGMVRRDHLGSGHLICSLSDEKLHRAEEAEVEVILQGVHLNMNFGCIASWWDLTDRR
jgi:hypothetical protein